MANTGIFPTADADFNIYINNANTYLVPERKHITHLNTDSYH